MLLTEDCWLTRVFWLIENSSWIQPTRPKTGGFTTNSQALDRSEAADEVGPPTSLQRGFEGRGIGDQASPAT